MCENEIALRQHMLEHNRCNLYKIGIRFKRRVGRSTSNFTVAAGQVLNHLTLNGTQTTSAFAGTVGDGAIGTGKIIIEPDVGNLAYIPNTGGELPFYSQNVDYHTNGWQTCERLRAGFPGRDAIDGVTTASVRSRYARVLNEMCSGREWKKHSGRKSLHFLLERRKVLGISSELIIRRLAL